MYLKTLTVTDFAGLVKAEIGGLEPGLNIIVGDNEVGKSTLLTALRAAFFQKHRASGEAVKAFAPYHGSGRPFVSLDFELGETLYSLSKAFLQRPSAELRWSGGQMSGDAVEEKLAELMRFTPPGRGEPKLSEHQGAFGLLWVEQGRSNAGLDLGAGKDALTASLEGEVGQILGGERGRTLTAAAKALQDRFFTDTLRAKTGSPLKAVEERLTAAEAERVEKQATLRELEDKLKRLADRRHTLTGYERDETVRKAEAALQEAEEAARRAGEREREWQAADAARKHAEMVRDQALDRLKRRDALIAAAAEAETRAAAVRAGFAAVDAEARQAAADVVSRTEDRERARDAARLAERVEEAVRAQRELERERQALAALDERVGRAEALAADLRGRQQALSAVTIDDKALKAIEAAEARRRDCAVRVTVAAPAVTFAPADASGSVHDAAGAAVPAGEAQRVTQRTTYALGGFGTVTIEPGGDAAALAEEHRAAEGVLAALLERVRVAGVESARAERAKARDLEAEIKALTARRDALLPEGPADAGRLREAAAASVERLAARLSDLDPAAAGEAGTDAMRERLESTRRALQVAEAALEEARRASSDAALRRATAEAEVAHRAAEAERLRAEARAAEDAQPRAALAEAVAVAEADRAAKAELLALRARERDAADPKAAAEALAARRTGLDRIRKTVGALRDEILSLEAELRHAGGTGLGEAITGLDDEIAVLQARRARLQLEADASRLLYGELARAQREAREHWLGPIKSRVAPYLKLIHPETEVELDEETLEIKALHRSGVAEDFKRLSAGAREQVAVVTRLALAHVLKTGGHPAAVILDDALVNTDEKRLERMHRVLERAAGDLQVIVLTCRERDFRDLGAPIFRL
ncbi:AAA family ATPase [Jiella sp. M17.18]|uniref:AAA family ATPase n=1 Tax=Jiella sp. M17.18 TaxID=3234247 RepID=UPI0034DF2F03